MHHAYDSLTAAEEGQSVPAWNKQGSTEKMWKSVGRLPLCLLLLSASAWTVVVLAYLYTSTGSSDAPHLSLFSRISSTLTWWWWCTDPTPLSVTAFVSELLRPVDILTAADGFALHGQLLPFDDLFLNGQLPMWWNATAERDDAAMTNGIPRVLHQSWKTTQLPAKFQRWSDAWSAVHPAWHRHVWTDEENRALVARYYPAFLSTYDALPRNIHRADAVRYVYMHRYGGVYSDLDAEPLKPLDILLEKRLAAIVDPDDYSSIGVDMRRVAADADLTERPQLLLGYLSKDWLFPHNVPNAFLASAPGHPFWLHCLREITRRLSQAGRCSTEAVTGPVMLYATLTSYAATLVNVIGTPSEVAVSDYTSYMKLTTVEEVEQVRRSYRLAQDISLLPAGVIYPYDWHNTTGPERAVCSAQSNHFDAAICRARFPDAYVVSYWSHSWEGPENTVIQKM